MQRCTPDSQGASRPAPPGTHFLGTWTEGPLWGLPFPCSDTCVPVTFAPGPAAPPVTLPEGSSEEGGQGLGGRARAGRQAASPRGTARARPPARIPAPLRSAAPSPARRCWTALSCRRHARAPAARFRAAPCRRRMCPGVPRLWPCRPASPWRVQFVTASPFVPRTRRSTRRP